MTPASPTSGAPFTTIDGERYYVVENVDAMPPFLMSIVSDGDRWMFLSSSGGVTAGRGNAENALFPYETDDRLHELGSLNGAATAIRRGGDAAIWRPTFGEMTETQSRRLLKSVVGDIVIFEERDDRLGLTFRYRWASCDRFGFVRTTTLTNDADEPCTLELADGIRNVLPHGLDPSLSLSHGNLANAYKRSELIDHELRLAVFSLESLVSDRAEPSEALRATTVWSVGLDEAATSLDPEAHRRRFGGSEDLDTLVTGRPGAYFLSASLTMAPAESRSWSIVADVGVTQPTLTALLADLHAIDDRGSALGEAVAASTHRLVDIMARADALQSTSDEVATAHHFSNVTYNLMRGGVPLDGYRVHVGDFVEHLRRRNRVVANRHSASLAALGDSSDRDTLLACAAASGDPDFIRLTDEYLPFSFSRRHGDPSRPWNAFSIRVTDERGNPERYYEGNWRDIFQNWEAIAESFPSYLPGMISVFVDASTADGFNPYRITSDGIDWETPDLGDPWSNIGYWGDHQIVYLLKLIEAAERHAPGAMLSVLNQRRFTYANVPYRIAPYEQILRDPKDTISFDEAEEQEIADRVADIGADGRLVWSEDGVYHVTFVEKLLVPALAKLSNFVPGGGIWMNTQRPEWNDANNALVGYGLSMVTLYQLRPYLDMVRTLVSQAESDVHLSAQVADWMSQVTGILEASPITAESQTDAYRKSMMDDLGTSFSTYRDAVHDSGFSGTTPVPVVDVVALCNAAIVHLDATILSCRRTDGLFDSYNALEIREEGGEVGIRRLDPMLEGQVAIVESGVLGAGECADVVDALFASDLYRPDQKSFLLYPARTLPSFLERNVVPSLVVESNPLLAELLSSGNGELVVEDIEGRIRFAATCSTRETVEGVLSLLAEDPLYADLVARWGDDAIQVYEHVFGHHTYTGRSGSMHAYEGIGSIYWHMVAKLLVALQSLGYRAAATDANPRDVERVVDAYWRVRSGLGVAKTPEEHGAIPIDPYSHTPAHAGAQQPGMTGLVKEEILIRTGELGVRVAEGMVQFDPTFLRRSEFAAPDRAWSTPNVLGDDTTTDIPEGSVGLTFCQVPIVVSIGADDPRVEVESSDGTTRSFRSSVLDPEISAQIFGRTGEIVRVRADLA